MTSTTRDGRRRAAAYLLDAGHRVVHGVDQRHVRPTSCIMFLVTGDDATSMPDLPLARRGCRSRRRLDAGISISRMRAP